MYIRLMWKTIATTVAVALSVLAAPAAQAPSAEAARRKTFDEILDTYVRDGDVYYRALKSERAKLDGYVPTSLAAVEADKLSRDEQIAFWLNAYNALVLRTVIDHYPIQGTLDRLPGEEHPPDSRRLRAAAASRRRPDADARSDRADDPAGLPRSARLLRARSRRRRQRPAAQRGVHRRAPRGAARRSRRRVRQPARSASRSIAATGKVLASSIFSWREKDFVGGLRGQGAARRSPTAARSSARCSPSSCRSC